MLEDRSTQTTVRTYIKVATHSPTHYRGAGSKLKVGTRIPAERAAKIFFFCHDPSLRVLHTPGWAQRWAVLFVRKNGL